MINSSSHPQDKRFFRSLKPPSQRGTKGLRVLLQKPKSVENRLAFLFRIGKEHKVNIVTCAGLCCGQAAFPLLWCEKSSMKTRQGRSSWLVV